MARIEDLQRAVRADPDDADAAVDLVRARARLEGPDVYLDPLADRRRWNDSSEAAQDMAIAEVARRLDLMNLFEVSTWSCEYKYWGQVGPDPRDVVLEGEVLSHRLATFNHRQTGMEMNLIPGGMKEHHHSCSTDPAPDDYECMACGDRRVGPFLIGRWPVTVGQSYDGHGFRDRVARQRVKPEVGKKHIEAEMWMDRFGVRLPSYDEWMHAMKAGAEARYYFGEELDSSHVWHRDNSAKPCDCCLPDDCSITHGQILSPRPPREHDQAEKWNAFGLVDMIGNVGEWLADGQEAGGNHRWFPLHFDVGMALEDPSGLIVSVSVSPDVTGFRAACSIPEAGK